MGYIAMAGVLGVGAYTMVFAWDAWEADNHVGAIGLGVLAFGTMALSFFELFLRG